MGAAAIPLIGGAVLGAVQGREEEKAAKRHNNAAAESNRYSDVTGHRMQNRSAGPGLLGGAVQGASTFGSLAGQMGALGGASQAAGGVNAVDKAKQYQGVADVFGGSGQSRQLGANGGVFGRLNS